jgi:hypothetical protein
MQLKSTGNSDNRYNSTVASRKINGGGGMMKKLFVLGLVGLMVMGLAAMAGAYAISIGVVGNGALGSGQVDFGDYQAAADGNAPASFPPSGGFLGAAAYIGVTPYIADYDPAHLSTTAWDFYVWNGNGSWAGTSAKLYAFVQDNLGSGNNGWGGTATTLTNWYVKDVTASVTYGPITFTGLANTSNDYKDAKAYLVSASIPVGAGSGTAGEHFQIYQGTALTTPEPGSLVAMFSGLVGLVGYGIRRRK